MLGFLIINELKTFLSTNHIPFYTERLLTWAVLLQGFLGVTGPCWWFHQSIWPYVLLLPWPFPCTEITFRLPTLLESLHSMFSKYLSGTTNRNLVCIHIWVPFFYSYFKICFHLCFKVFKYFNYTIDYVQVPTRVLRFNFKIDPISSQSLHPPCYHLLQVYFISHKLTNKIAFE